MKTLSMIVIVLLASPAGASELKARNVLLENGVVLHIERIQFSRILPHSYHDQAIASIPGVYPASQIIAKRRMGYLGNNKPAAYSIVCYKKSTDLNVVTISGAVTGENKAWSFDAVADEAAFADTLVLVMEVIARVPFDQSLQPLAEQSR